MSKLNLLAIGIVFFGMSLTNPVAASDVGQCNAIAGQALGIAHQIDAGVGDAGALCMDLGAVFNAFGGAGCIPPLINGELFLNAAVGQYFLACDVFKNVCGADPQSFGICPFDI